MTIIVVFRFLLNVVAMFRIVYALDEQNKDNIQLEVEMLKLIIA